MSAVKEELERMARDLPEDATWEDVQEAIYIRQVVDQGLKDVAQGKVRSVDEVRKDYGLPPLR
jgi:hypothetical protein